MQTFVPRSARPSFLPILELIRGKMPDSSDAGVIPTHPQPAAKGPEVPAAVHAFISYRRADGAALAVWLRNRLQAYRLPPLTGFACDEPIRVFLDTSYEKAGEDFWVSKIEPNLEAARALILVVTPKIEVAADDGQENWVQREVRSFLEKKPDAPVLLVLGRGSRLDMCPEPLQLRSQRWDPVDFRELSLRTLAVNDWEARDRELRKLVAGLHDIPANHLPALHQEDARNRRRALLSIVVATIVALSMLSGLSIWALLERHRAEQHLLASQSQQLAAEAELMLRQEPARLDHALSLALESLNRGGGVQPAAQGVLREAMALRAGPVATLSLASSVRDLAFIPGRGLLAVSMNPDPGAAGSERQLALWSLQDSCQIRLWKHESAVTAVTASEDGRWLATATESGKIRVLDLDHPDQRPTLEVEQGGGAVYGLRFHPDGRRLWAVGAGGTAVLWSVDTPVWEQICYFGGGLSRIQSAAAGQRWVLAGGVLRGALSGLAIGAGASCDWQQLDHDTPLPGAPAAGQTRSINDTDESYLREVSISADGRLVLSAGDDGSARVWRGTDGNMLSAQRFDSSVFSVALAPDGQTAAAGDMTGRVLIWNSEDGSVLRELRQAGTIRILQFLHAGQWLAVADSESSVRVYETRSGRERVRISLSALATHIVIDPLGQQRESSLQRSRRRDCLRRGTCRV